MENFEPVEEISEAAALKTESASHTCDMEHRENIIRD